MLFVCRPGGVTYIHLKKRLVDEYGHSLLNRHKPLLHALLLLDEQRFQELQQAHMSSTSASSQSDAELIQDALHVAGHMVEHGESIC